jgi:hypothetical protein
MFEEGSGLYDHHFVVVTGVLPNRLVTPRAFFK